VRWPLAALIALVGLIHLYTAPDQFNDATYKGLLFLANGTGSAVAAFGIVRGLRRADQLALLIAVGTVAAYVCSRTLGLPGLGVDANTFEPLGVLSVVAACGYTAVLLYARSRTAKARGWAGSEAG
jgi:hypothetical protein